MKPFFTFCMVLTVIQVLSVINGVSSDVPRRPDSKDPTPAAPPKQLLKRPAPKDTTTDTTSTDKKTQKSAAGKKEEAPAKKPTPAAPAKKQAPAKKPAPAASAEKPAPTGSAEKPAQDANSTDDGDVDDDDDDDPLPTDLPAARQRLAKTVRKEASRKAVDVVNGGTGLLRMGIRLMGLMGGLVRRQAGNGRKVIREGFGMANGLGDSASRGAVRVMRNTAGVGRDVAGRMGDVADAAAVTTKKFSRLGGTAATIPFSVAGDVADLGTAAVTIPKNASKKVTGFVTQSVLPRLGADQITSMEADGAQDATADQVDEVEEEEVVDDADATSKQSPSS